MSGSVSEDTDKDFVEPKKCIIKINDMGLWTKSKAYQDYIGFLVTMNEAIKGRSLKDSSNSSEVTENVSKMLDQVSVWIDEIPPIDQPQRFGNKAFRSFYDRLKNETAVILKEALPSEFHASIVELAPYFIESFGNSTRIDYGTGHEMLFGMFLCCLFQLKAFTIEDSEFVVNKIFYKYLKLMHKLQTTYRMEPAGSHGVWSLDDYQFLPFIWGSAQLISNPKISPKCFTEPEVAEKYSDDFMFMTCIKYINSVKTGPFAEHSNQLWNISGVVSWSKINSGLIKMYKAEVLGKFPVMQHTLFGSIMPFEST